MQVNMETKEGWAWKIWGLKKFTIKCFFKLLNYDEALQKILNKCFSSC